MNTRLLRCAIFAGLATAARGQDQPPPLPVGPPPVGVPGQALGQTLVEDANGLAHRLADAVRRLGEDVGSDLGRTQAGAQLAQDAAELARAIDEFHETLHGRQDPQLVRRAFGPVEGSWQNLRARLSQPGAATPAVAQAARRVEEIDDRLRNSLGLNAPPPGFYDGNAPTSGIAETRRLAHALVSRAEDLAGVIRAELSGAPGGAALDNDARNLARAADTFHDALHAEDPIQVAAQAFAPVDALADRVERQVAGGQVSPRVANAWQAFASVEVLIHQNLGLASQQPQVNVQVAPPQGGGPSPIAGLADQLAEQIDAFVAVWTPTAGAVPEGVYMLADAQRLQAEVADFRRDAAQGLDAGRLAFEFRDIDATAQRLSRRVARVARGRIGPNIAQVMKVGETVGQLHQALGMPGYAPDFRFGR